MKAVLFCFLVLLQLPASAQQPRVWRKEVMKIIDMRSFVPVDSASRVFKERFSAVLIEGLEKDRLAGWVWGYDERAPYEPRQKFFADDLYRYCRVDLYDNDSTRRAQEAAARKMFYDSLYMFGVLEDWLFYPDSGRAVVNIKAIIPLHLVWGDDGKFRGRRKVCCFMYPDVRRYLGENEKLLIQPFSDFLWYGAFCDDSSATGHLHMHIDDAGRYVQGGNVRMVTHPLYAPTATQKYEELSDLPLTEAIVAAVEKR